MEQIDARFQTSNVIQISNIYSPSVMIIIQKNTLYIYHVAIFVLSTNSRIPFEMFPRYSV